MPDVETQQVETNGAVAVEAAPETPKAEGKAPVSFKDSLTDEQRLMLYGAEPKPEDFTDTEEATEDADESTEEADAVEAEPEPEVAEETPDEPYFDPELLYYADQMGIGEDEAKAFGSPEALAKTLTVMYRRENSRAKSDTPPVERIPKGEAKAKSIDWDSLSEKFDPDVIAAMKSMHEQSEAQIAALQAKVGEFESVTEKQQRERIYARNMEFEQFVDNKFNALPDHFKPIYGTGKSIVLKGSKQPNDKKTFAAREKHVKVMKALMDTGVERDPERAFQMALASVTEGKQKQIARTEVADALKKRAATAIAKPTERTIEPRNGRERAARRIDEWNKARGNPGASMPDTEVEF